MLVVHREKNIPSKKIKKVFRISAFIRELYYHPIRRVSSRIFRRALKPRFSFVKKFGAARNDPLNDFL
ncbi:hypothetical protein LEP1GSC060_2593 [Leptospira weilii serovar Ranarum str. ICFT]|uniref:Uncharacterized protein n=1 Tax=Leptospira weilii serovar Ranarum str. ICFT TaxID=1218598 RepID=N1WH23_9LEPT|nr:hypothetical protein LEP1GSC060_2593 [Leptospira weilii serovar Ranarum str. ICFT]